MRFPRPPSVRTGAGTASGRSLVALAAAGTAGLGWSLAEARAFRLRRYELPVLRRGRRPLRVLHLSDLHLVPRQRAKRAWLRRLGALEPDLVVDTGDNLASPDAVPAVLDALEPLLHRPGVFVPGSNDYYGPVVKNPAKYLWGHRPSATPSGTPLPWTDLRDAFVGSGWIDLTNATGVLDVDGVRLAFAGTDDPHLRRDDFAALGAAPADADLAIGVTHAPYRRVLDAFVGTGYDLVLAGHTHGGQLCVPGHGALVTNCDLDTRRARGVSRHPAGGGDDAGWLHVSAGIGTSPYTPVRFACPPEASLLTLLPYP